MTQRTTTTKKIIPDTPYPSLMIPQASGHLRYCPDFVLEMSSVISQPRMAEKVHLFVLQVAYLCNEARQDRRSHNYQEGHWWTYQSIREWQSKFFKTWSISTMERVASLAVSEGYIVAGEYNSMALDRTAWYRPNWDKLSVFKTIQVTNYNPPAALENPPSDEEETPDSVNLTESRFRQIDGVDSVNLKQQYHRLHIDSIEEEEGGNNTKPCNNPPIQENHENFIGEDMSQPIRFPIDEWGNRIPAKFNIRDHPKFIELRALLLGNLTGLPAEERRNFYARIVVASEEIDGWWDWCVAQARGNGKGKSWTVYQGYIFKGMDFDEATSTYKTNYTCDFSRWLRGEFNTIMKAPIEVQATTKGASAALKQADQPSGRIQEMLEEMKQYVW